MATVFRDARVISLTRGPRPRRGTALGDLAAIDIADVLVEDDRITAVGQDLVAPPGTEEIDAAGRVLMPGFVDCHTHALWAGHRLEEWEMRLKGAKYLDILAAGGGIMATVRAVRAAPDEQLEANLLQRLHCALASGTTTIEVKSGYGLTTQDELRMLRTIRRAAAQWPGTVISTALLGHAIDPDIRPSARFIDSVIKETLPAIHEEFPGITIDAFCEESAWSLDACLRLFESAKRLGHPIRVHTDQFTPLGMLTAAVRMGARSVDHLEAAKPADLAALAESNTFAVLLPASGFHLDDRYADGGAILNHDSGGTGAGAVCIASNLNPGSAPCASMPMVIALAVRRCKMTVGQAIAAATINPADLLNLPDRGQVAAGQRADLVLLRHTDERFLAYEFGANPVDLVMVAGGIARPGAQ
jgi:imidazolonepropionase